MTRARLGFLLAAAMSLAAVTVRAAPPPPDDRSRAAESFREAQAAFERRDYAAAAAAFEAAAGFASHPAALLSAADSWDRAGEPARAAEDCDRAASLPTIGEASATDHVDYAHDASQCLDRLRARVAVIDLRGSGAMAVRLDDGPQRVLPARIWARPGRHSLTVTDLSSSQSRHQDLDLGAGEQRRMDLSAAPAPTPASTAPRDAQPVAPSPAPEASSHPLPVSSWVAFGVAGAASVIYGVTGVMTVQAQSAFDSTPTVDTKNTFYRDRTLADAAFAVAVVGAAAGVVLWLVTPGTPPSTALSPAVLRF